MFLQRKHQKDKNNGSVIPQGGMMKLSWWKFVVFLVDYKTSQLT